MAINYGENNTYIVEQTLSELIRRIFVRLKMGQADWDMDVSLRNALHNPSNLNKIKDLVHEYDKGYDLATKSKIQINKKYSVLYNLKK